MQNSKYPPRRSQKKRRIWPWVLLFFCFAAAAIGGALFANSSLLDKPIEEAVDDGLLTAKDKTTVMIMGVDERDGDVGRSDTLMIAAVDPKQKQASLLSVPRDTRVKIKGHGFDKVNAAYAYGHEKLTQDTVENLLGVNIEHYVIINTKSFAKIIDALGGIDIDVPKRMHYEDPYDDDGGLLIDFQPGMQHMDGAKAITYVRYRDEEGDLGRIRRQQDFIKACIDKMVSPAVIPKLPGIIREVMGSIKTDLSFRQLLELAGTLKESKSNGLKTDMVPGRPLYIDGVSYWIPDLSKIRTTVAETLGVNMSAKVRSRMENDIKEYERSIPSTAKEVPASDKSIGNTKSNTSSKPNRRSELRSNEAGERNESNNSRRESSSKPESSPPSAPEQTAPSRSGAGASKTQ
ncbi:MAG: LCP family protein [Selenomonas sp.]|uniref:LCP family glycopolymer transferase n=1 Tax=Selenomonas sp. TaxID=2053611 RepID=UPI0025E85EA3|nr:LCP family protein [Selenomonas sp.]MCR5438359.1 LCP family protein [Selenomonas sp.]